MLSPTCLYVCVFLHQPLNGWTDLYIITPERISEILTISLCICVYSPLVARQRLSKNIASLTNTYATIEELLDGWSGLTRNSYTCALEYGKAGQNFWQKNESEVQNECTQKRKCYFGFIFPLPTLLSLSRCSIKPAHNFSSDNTWQYYTSVRRFT